MYKATGDNRHLEASSSSQSYRHPFSEQPNQYLIVESTLLGKSTVETLGRVVAGVLVLANKLSGTPRIPYFGLSSITNEYFECLIPLSSVKDNPDFGKTIISVEKLASEVICRPNETQARSNILAVPSFLIEKVIQQAVKQMNELKTCGAISDNQNMQIVYVTGRNSSLLAQQVGSSISQESLVGVHYINFVQIDDSDASDNSVTEADIAHGFGSLILPPNELALEGYFKGWLHDVEGDVERVCLILGTSPAIALKLDLQEALLNIDQLPLNEYCKLMPDVGHTQFVPPSKKSGNTRIPVYILKATSMVKRESISEASIFGIPMLLTPSRSWKLDWEDAATNEENFVALTQSLEENDMVLIANVPITQKTLKSVSGYFVLFPCTANRSFLIKPIASREILLPRVSDPLLATVIEPSEAQLKSVRQCLDQLKSDPHNPLFVQSCLTEWLSNMLKSSIDK